MASFNVGETYTVLNDGTQYCSFLKPGNNFTVKKVITKYKILVDDMECALLSEDVLKKITKRTGGGKRSSKKSKRRRKSKRRKKSKRR